MNIQPRFVLLFLLIGLGFSFCGTAIAGQAEGKVIQIAVVQEATGKAAVGLIYFQPGAHVNAPACQSTKVKDRFAVDLDSAAGRAIYETAMTAWLAGIGVQVKGADAEGGTPNCLQWPGDSETAYYISTTPAAMRNYIRK